MHMFVAMDTQFTGAKLCLVITGILCITVQSGQLETVETESGNGKWKQ